MYEGDSSRGSEWSNRTGTEKPVRTRERGNSGIEFGTPRLSTNRDRTPGSEITGKFASATDPEVGLYNKDDGEPAKLCSINEALMENHSGLAVDGSITEAIDKHLWTIGKLRATVMDRLTTRPPVMRSTNAAARAPRSGLAGSPFSRSRPRQIA